MIKFTSGRFNTQPPEGGWSRLPTRWFKRSSVSTHSRPKAAAICRLKCSRRGGFNTQPPEGGWVPESLIWGVNPAFQHTAARRRLGPFDTGSLADTVVSTHSRPKAAGATVPKSTWIGCCFNTQPPEGGWLVGRLGLVVLMMFQHTAARRRLAFASANIFPFFMVSTHSRPKAAGSKPNLIRRVDFVSTHSRPKAAGAYACTQKATAAVSTHSRPKAAGKR